MYPENGQISSQNKTQQEQKHEKLPWLLYAAQDNSRHEHLGSAGQDHLTCRMFS
jgi:hypothetical protein